MKSLKKIIRARVRIKKIISSRYCRRKEREKQEHKKRFENDLDLISQSFGSKTK